VIQGGEAVQAVQMGRGFAPTMPRKLHYDRKRNLKAVYEQKSLTISIISCKKLRLVTIASSSVSICLITQLKLQSEQAGQDPEDAATGRWLSTAALLHPPEGR
jgi:hypothetical protein